MSEILILSLTPSDCLLSKRFKCLQFDTVNILSQLFTRKNNPLRLSYLKLSLDKASKRVGF